MTGQPDAGGSGGGGAAAGCANGEKDGSEADVDCGGTCPACDDGAACQFPNDCASHVCAGATCQAATCDDGVVNAAETGLDCGGGACQPCEVNAGCAVDTDCGSGSCAGGLCVATIHVTSAIWAANCGAPTPVAAFGADCDGEAECMHSFNYTADVGFDPAYGCYKDLRVRWDCGDGETQEFYAACAPCDPVNSPTVLVLLSCTPELPDPG